MLFKAPIWLVAIATCVVATSVSAQEVCSSPPPAAPDPGSCKDCLAGKPKCYFTKRSLKVQFLGGTPQQHALVRKFATNWSDHSGIQFVFDAPRGDIRISFNDGGSHSVIGTCHKRGDNEATMNFGWLTPGISDSAARRVIVHEFGHALGFIHEQSQPLAEIPWNRAKVMEYYKRTQGWTEDQIKRNVLENHEPGETNYSAYDKASIMHYAIPSELTVGGYSTPWNDKLSPLDKQYVSNWYPRKGQCGGNSRYTVELWTGGGKNDATNDRVSATLSGGCAETKLAHDQLAQSGVDDRAKGAHNVYGPFSGTNLGELTKIKLTLSQSKKNKDRGKKDLDDWTFDKVRVTDAAGDCWETVGGKIGSKDNDPKSIELALNACPPN